MHSRRAGSLGLVGAWLTFCGYPQVNVTIRQTPHYAASQTNVFKRCGTSSHRRYQPTNQRRNDVYSFSHASYRQKCQRSPATVRRGGKFAISLWQIRKSFEQKMSQKINECKIPDILGQKSWATFFLQHTDAEDLIKRYPQSLCGSKAHSLVYLHSVSDQFYVSVISHEERVKKRARCVCTNYQSG